MSSMPSFQTICRAFLPGCCVQSVEEIKIGHINQTYHLNLLLENGQSSSVLLQGINCYVFRQPKLLMENIEKVCLHLQKQNPQGCNLHFYHSQDGCNYYIDDSGFWRLCNFIPSITYSSVDDLSIVAEAAKAFGQFQKQLLDFPAAQLHETIPNFHNTRSRYAALKQAVADDAVQRLSACQPELEALLALEEQACLLTDWQQQGKLPLRVTHNDTKINNVLFDEEGKALCVIDLDTVMPGLLGHDFGDAIRTAANTEAEDSCNLDKVTIDLSVFKAFTQAFLSVLGNCVSDNEIDTLALSALALTTENAVRFLTDYLQGDVYFKVAHPEHNLQRCRCQLALALEMQKHMDEMNDIVHQCLLA